MTLVESPTGPASVEFKRDEKTKRWRPPHHGRSLRVSGARWSSGIRCGVDFPRLYLDMCLERPFEPVLEYQAGRKLSLLRERVMLELSTGTKWPAFLLETLRPDEFDIDWGDLRPTLRELRATYWDYHELRRERRAPRAALVTPHGSGDVNRNGSGPVRVLVTEGEGKPALAAVRSLGAPDARWM